MNKILYSFLAACMGALGFAFFSRDSAQNRIAALAVERQWQAGTNDLAKMQDMTALLRAEVQSKKKRLRQSQQHPEISPEILLFLEGHTGKLTLENLAKLRTELGIGWDISSSYVLVPKQIVKELEYARIYSGTTPADKAVELMALTPDEQAAIKEALESARQGQWLHVERAEPSGDIVAQYTVSPPDPTFEQSQSNNFAAEITAAIGTDRASFYLPQAWDEFVSDLAPSQSETMTIRQTVIDGQSDLVCEVKQGDRVSTSPVRYARYPNFPVMEIFPGGWQAVAQAEGFDLPPSFNGQNSSPP